MMKEHMMTNRLDTDCLNTTADILKNIRTQLQDMSCSRYMGEQERIQRVLNLIHQLDNLRYEVLNEVLVEG